MAISNSYVKLPEGMGNSTIIYGIYVEYIVIPTTGWWFGMFGIMEFLMTFHSY
jgi:hypothetical protein